MFGSSRLGSNPRSHIFYLGAYVKDALDNFSPYNIRTTRVYLPDKLGPNYGPEINYTSLSVSYIK